MQAGAKDLFRVAGGYKRCLQGADHTCLQRRTLVAQGLSCLGRFVQEVIIAC